MCSEYVTMIVVLYTDYSEWLYTVGALEKVISSENLQKIQTLNLCEWLRIAIQCNAFWCSDLRDGSLCGLYRGDHLSDPVHHGNSSVHRQDDTKALEIVHFCWNWFISVIDRFANGRGYWIGGMYSIHSPSPDLVIVINVISRSATEQPTWHWVDVDITTRFAMTLIWNVAVRMAQYWREGPRGWGSWYVLICFLHLWIRIDSHHLSIDYAITCYAILDCAMPRSGIRADFIWIDARFPRKCHYRHLICSIHLVV